MPWGQTIIFYHMTKHGWIYHLSDLSDLSDLSIFLQLSVWIPSSPKSLPVNLSPNSGLMITRNDAPTWRGDPCLLGHWYSDELCDCESFREKEESATDVCLWETQWRDISRNLVHPMHPSFQKLRGVDSVINGDLRHHFKTNWANRRNMKKLLHCCRQH